MILPDLNVSTPFGFRKKYNRTITSALVIMSLLITGLLYGCQSPADSTVKEPSLALDTEKIVIDEHSTSASITIRNSGDGVLEWTLDIAGNENCLKIDTASGSGDRAVTITVDKSNLKTGTHTFSIDISSNGGNKTIDIIIIVPETGSILIEGDIPTKENS